MPTNSELYTSLVMRARAIATRGGMADHYVEYRAGSAESSAARAMSGTAAAIKTASPNTHKMLLLLIFNMYYLQKIYLP